MIPYCSDRLAEWAKWSWQRIDGGFRAGQFKYDEPLPRPDFNVLLTPSDPRCLETEEGVAWLCLEHYTIGLTVCVHYRDHPDWSVAMQSNHLRCADRTLFWRLNKGHELLIGYFLDRSLGLVPQTEELRMRKRARAA